MIYSGVDRPGRKAGCLNKNAAFLHKVLKNLSNFKSKSWLFMVFYGLFCMFLLSITENLTKYQNFLTELKHPRGLRDKTNTLKSCLMYW